MARPHNIPIRACTSDLCRSGRDPCPTPMACQIPATDDSDELLDDLNFDPFAGAGLAAAVCLAMALIVIVIDRGPWLLAWLGVGQ